ncbi:hypothetical protein [Dyella silvatica]|uniref:hypothetical protein n=1 Tax=Dyella silvatica TaxID=2992128 RepID=UPI00224D629C|nr:hypothetical protein [Dyella silvatica]
MTARKNIRWACAFCAVCCLVGLGPVFGQTSANQTAAASAKTTADSRSSATNTYRDGQHDFDFNLGRWKTHIKRMQHPLSGSAEWVELNGTVDVRNVWQGRGKLEEIEADGPDGHFEGLTLFLYNPKSHQWSQTFASSDDGTLGPPAVGEFKQGRGELVDQEPFEGRTILVRATWSDITPDAHRFEQAFSDDGGKTWEPNFIATLTRAK